MFALHASVSKKSERLTKDEEKRPPSSFPFLLLSLEKYPKKKKKITIAASKTV